MKRLKIGFKRSHIRNFYVPSGMLFRAKLGLLTMIIVLFSSCTKDDLPSPDKSLKEKLKECRGCSGGWDLTDTIP
ncbi:MAG: hypothetical protein B7X86_13950 [Sphingobacteriales bacterium 17-39-43]|uniref:hypothetical protein n=1 Tax=Daejeonella sp. TaxID=2805397 RepID=UPI000BC4A8B8|nr:hypothetical protein [Daejeonella sp.]OYZ30171.1 MAG: hypothetical protein B7Y24_13715 [Sphingobacteriales bacterium 16-39-50]OZA22914.1 MAG: hypothetical protein B7X86_13950 [Sphingobacteriales bacterium 17-39-43]HQT58805.1 hypothetical protein [Daejeonella sp.]